jgi:hypothetical protein
MNIGGMANKQILSRAMAGSASCFARIDCPLSLRMLPFGNLD